MLENMIRNGATVGAWVTTHPVRAVFYGLLAYALCSIVAAVWLWRIERRDTRQAANAQLRKVNPVPPKAPGINPRRVG